MTRAPGRLLPPLQGPDAKRIGTLAWARAGACLENGTPAPTPGASRPA